jgi:hypothetical protein
MTAFPENATEVRPDKIDFVQCHDPDAARRIGLVAYDPKFHPVAVILTLTAARQMGHTLLAMADELDAES